MVKTSRGLLIILFIIIVMFLIAGYLIQEKVSNDTSISLFVLQGGEIVKINRKFNKLQNELNSLKSKLDNTSNKVSL